MENKNKLMIERVFNAPRELVWQAWTDPEMIKQWWGPKDVSIPECEIDLMVGGKIYIVMEAGKAMGKYKGKKWPMLGKFTFIEPKVKLAYSVQAWTEGNKEETLIDQSTDLTLSEEKGKTKLILNAIVYKTGPQAEMAVQGMELGFNQQLDKLEKFLSIKK